MEQFNEELIDEIKQLRTQYLEEIGDGGRKPWPKSIKSRVIKLCKSGMPVGKVSELTGIPYHSVLPWRRKAGLARKKRHHRKKEFHSLTVTDTVQKEITDVPALSSTVTVKVNNIGEIEFPDARAVADFILHLKARGA